MQIIYEATDALIHYGLESNSQEDSILAWNTYFSSAPGPVHGGLAFEYSKASATRETTLIGAYAKIDFYGSSCAVLGGLRGAALAVRLDDAPLVSKQPFNQSTILLVKDLPVGWHVLSLKVTKFDEGTDYIGLERVILETEPSDSRLSLATYRSEEDAWDLTGTWTHHTLNTDGTLEALATAQQWDSASLQPALPFPSKVFLYGNVGKDHGLVEVSWVEINPALIKNTLRVVYSGESDTELNDVLLYMGVVSAGGWDNFTIKNFDSRGTRRLEFTRLEVYANASPSPVLASTSTDALSTSTSDTRGAETSSLFPTVVGVAVAGSITLAALFVFFFLRARRRRRAMVADPRVPTVSLRPFGETVPNLHPPSLASRSQEDAVSSQKLLLTVYRAMKQPVDSTAGSSTSQPGPVLCSSQNTRTSEQEPSAVPQESPRTAPPAYSAAILDY